MSTMRTLTLLPRGALLMAFFFQCSPLPAPTPTFGPAIAPADTATEPAPGSTAGQQPPLPPEQPTTVQPQVIQVIDGDTLQVEINGDVYAVRYIDVNCPQSDTEFGPISADMNRAPLEGRTVGLERDVSETDEYGRLLRYVYVDDTFVNRHLIENGYALTLAPDITHLEELLQCEQDPRLSSLGLRGFEETRTCTAPGATATPIPPSPAPQPPKPVAEPPTPSPITPADVVVSPTCSQFDPQETITTTQMRSGCASQTREGIPSSCSMVLPTWLDSTSTSGGTEILR